MAAIILRAARSFTSSSSCRAVKQGAFALWGADGSQMLLFGCVSCMPLLPARSSLQQIFEGGQTTPHHSQGSDAQDSPMVVSCAPALVLKAGYRH
jgi:hypothetical protein